MSERASYPPGVPCWVDTIQPNPDAALEFYGALLGWDFAGPGTMPGDPPGSYHVARVRGKDVAGIGSLPAGSAPAWMTYVAIDSVDAVTQRAREAGGTIVADGFDAPPAGRMAVLQDPAGGVFCIWEAGDRRGAQLINEPATWAMSTLATSDPGGAEAFYRAAFGWEAEEFGPGVWLFRLPGYVGGEPEQPVPRDVVAVMLADDRDAVWTVDVWVNDVDAVAARATELGGSIAVLPHDIPGFRNAVIADPQGAVLSVSQLLAGG